ncbi:MAG: NAD(P)/FAD-dependent oxidoreductase [Clostridia bacterium]|nr:NAD(P)/FAD-dependent oxidoreductase [Clostridia bacterium]
MNFDYAIIGGGVVGSAILNKLTRLGKSCILLEKESDVGFGSSKANSAIIHTGFDCTPGTLKAQLNVRGAKLFPEIAKRLGVKIVNNGHLVVGNDLEHLKELKVKGETNGVESLRIVDSDELHKMEPMLSKDIKYALYAPTGCIVPSYELAVAFAEEAVINGAVVKLCFDTKLVHYENGIYQISNGNEKVNARVIINACGSGYNSIAELIGSETYPLQFRRGEYYILDKNHSNVCSHTIFPLPTKESKGILITNTVAGNILVGPTSYESDTSTKTTSGGLGEVREKALSEMPNLPLRGNIRVFSGVRNISGKDFIIEKSQLKENVINLAGICSPGLSSAPAIAEMVAELLGLNPNAEIKELKSLPKKVIMADLSLEEQNELILQNSSYGKVVCKCENISLGEIIDAVNSPIPARTVDAVKRRTRAGMGRCQGGFCIFSVMEEIAKANNIRFDDIEKDAKGSKIIKSDIKPDGGMA